MRRGRTAGRDKHPTRRARWWLTWLTRRSAAREAANPNAGIRLERGIATIVGELAYQRVVGEALRRWIERTAARAASAFAALNQALAEVRRLELVLIEELASELEKARRVAVRLEVSTVTLVALIVAGALGMATAWPFFHAQAWPLPLMLLAAIGVAAVEIALAAGTGALIYALVLDEYRSVFELTPKQRTWTLVSALAFGAMTLVLVIALSFLRGSGFDRLLWLALGVAAAGLGSYTGAAAYESRHHLKARALRKQLHKTQSKADMVRSAYGALERDTMACGRTHRSVAADVEHRGELAYEKTWRRYHRDPAEVMPTMPPLDLPTDKELERALLVPLRDPGWPVLRTPARRVAGTTQAPHGSNGTTPQGATS
jgi:hypothetical protein